MFNRLKRARKINYFQNALEENKQNIQQTWSILRKDMGKLINKTSFYSNIFNKWNFSTHKFQIAEGFNDYFLKLAFRPIKTCRNQIQFYRIYGKT